VLLEVLRALLVEKFSLMFEVRTPSLCCTTMVHNGADLVPMLLLERADQSRQGQASHDLPSIMTALIKYQLIRSLIEKD